MESSAGLSATSDAETLTSVSSPVSEKTAGISIENDSFSDRGIGTCCCSAGADESPVEVLSGRPDLRAIIDRNLQLARGETGVAVCGPQALMARTRTVVAELSDERGAEKGTGAYGIGMFGEGFGW